MESYTKLHSFKHIINGFAVHTTPSEARKLREAEGVVAVERDRGVRKMTTYTPQFLGVPSTLRATVGCKRNESSGGEGIVIGFVDSGIDPTHPSFGFGFGFGLDESSKFCGVCEEGPFFGSNSCNGKIVGARFFCAGAQAVSQLNSSVDFLSPFDAEGHGR